LFTVGRKAEGYFRFRDYPIDGANAGFSDAPSYEDARAVAEAVVAGFESGDLDRVQLVYTRFISAGRQEVVVEPLLPLEPEDAPAADAATSSEPTADYEFEPNPEAILRTLLPRYTESRVYAALLNAAASEHAARQRAMKAATDNAEDLILTYRRRMNRARQDSITTEIMEIVGGAEALSQGADDQHDTQAAEYYDKTA
jgi:F-type H+-transporting ATPase subunit gamma